MLDAITSGLLTCISWIGSVLTALTGSSGALAALLPVIGAFIAMSIVYFGIRVIKSLVYGF